MASFGRGAYTYRFGAPQKCGTEIKPVVLHPKTFANKLLKSFGFEGGAQGWLATTNDSTGVMAWRNGSPGHGGANSEQVVPYTQGEGDGGNHNASLTSPALRLPHDSNVRVSWWKAQNTEPGFDGLSLDWSSDGKIWNTVSTKLEGDAQFPTFTADKASFVAPQGPLYLRFRVTSDPLLATPPYLGVMLDDVEVRY